MATNLPFSFVNSIFRTTPEVFTKFYFVESHGFLNTKELTFCFQILDFLSLFNLLEIKDPFRATGHEWKRSVAEHI